MPRGDATGPMGLGPMTGRAAGYCAGYNLSEYRNNAPGRGCGMGFGHGGGFGAGGRGRRNRFYATGGWAAPLANPESEKQSLKSQAEYLQSEMDAIQKRLDELNAKSQGQ